MTEQEGLILDRHDLSADKSLRAWSAADELMAAQVLEAEADPKNLVLYNDRFGYLACQLHVYKPLVILSKKSQEEAISKNLQTNKLEPLAFETPLASLMEKMDLALINMPKSLDLFELFLDHIHKHSTDDVEVKCGFMTKHFSAGMLTLAKRYFSEVEQSKAVKKSRVLSLKGKRDLTEAELIQELPYGDTVYKQYKGIFSKHHIDFATQFFLDNLDLPEELNEVLDLGSGNGIMAAEIAKIFPDANYHLMDDAILAIESAKLNFDEQNVSHHWTADLSQFKDESFDLVVSNPPFHFEHEVNIQIPLSLFQEAHRCLKSGGSFQLVANTHLNYKTHLVKWFHRVDVLAENDKFVVYDCLK